jgi:hypothetical protein
VAEKIEATWLKGTPFSTYHTVLSFRSILIDDLKLWNVTLRGEK